MIWAVPVCSGQYRYCPEHTGTVQSIPVPKPNRYCPEHTGTAQSIPVLSGAYRYCPGVSSSRLTDDLEMLYNFSDTSDVHNIDDDDDDLEVISESVSKSPKDKLTKYNHRNSVQISPKTTSKKVESG